MARPPPGHRSLDEILDCLRRGDIRGIGARTQRNFYGPIQTIIPWAANLYTQPPHRARPGRIRRRLLGLLDARRHVRRRHGLHLRSRAERRSPGALGAIMREAKRAMERAVPFAMEPVVYDFTINERGTWAELLYGADSLLPAGYYTLTRAGARPPRNP
ncbi:MAG: hypothetical protein QM757_18700 [Paludibaculum sp.]